MSKIQLHGVDNKRKKDTDKTNLFFNLIWNSLKQTALNWNIYFDWVIRLGGGINIYRYQKNGVQQRKERQT